MSKALRYYIPYSCAANKERALIGNGLTFLDDISPRVVTGASSRSDRLPSNRQSTTVDIN